MEFDTARLEVLRPDAQRFVVGVLWMTALAALTGGSGSVLLVLRFLDTCAAQLTHITVTPFVTGFIAVLACIIIPYCLAEAFSPLAVAMMNLTLRIQHRLAPQDLAFFQLAGASLADALHTKMVPPIANWITYIHVHDREISEILRKSGRVHEFRASALIPASTLLAWFLTRTLEPLLPHVWALVFSFLFGLGSFVAGAYYNNRRLHDHWLNVALATQSVAKAAIEPRLGHTP